MVSEEKLIVHKETVRKLLYALIEALENVEIKYNWAELSAALDTTFIYWWETHE